MDWSHISSLDSTSPQRHWSASGQCHNVSRQASEVCPTEWPDHRDSRGSSMHAGLGRKEWRPGWLVVAKRPDPVERMRMEGGEKRRSACRRPSSSRSFVCSRCGGKIRWGWRLDLLASPSVGHPLLKIISWRLTAVNSKLFAGHSFPRPSSSSPSMSCPSTIPSNPPSSFPTAVHQRATNSSPDIKA